MSNRRVRIGMALIGLLLACAIFGPLVVANPNDQPDITRLQNAPPSRSHPLGTDFFSRDVLSRVLHGARISLSIGLVSVLLSLTVGAAVGLAAGFAGGAADMILMRMVDAALAIPRLFLLLVVITILQTTGITTLILILGLTSWFETSRLVRAEVLSVKQREYVTASRALGIPTVSVITRHVLPNTLGPILVSGTLGVGTMILIEAGLSFLGLGVAPPTPTLGNIMRDGRDSLLQAPWIVISPSVVVVLTVLAFSVLSDGLREVNEPRAGAR